MAVSHAEMKSQQDFLRDAMQSLDLTRFGFAKRISVPEKTLNKWMSPSDTTDFRSMPDVVWAYIREILVWDRVALDIPPMGVENESQLTPMDRRLMFNIQAIEGLQRLDQAAAVSRWRDSLQALIDEKSMSYQAKPDFLLGMEIQRLNSLILTATTTEPALRRQEKSADKKLREFWAALADAGYAAMNNGAKVELTVRRDDGNTLSLWINRGRTTKDQEHRAAFELAASSDRNEFYRHVAMVQKDYEDAGIEVTFRDLSK